MGLPWQGETALAGAVGRAAVYGAALPVIRDRNALFNVQAILLNVLYLFVTAQLFGGTMTDKLTACLINGTMCLLVENTVNYTYSWFTGVRTGEAWQHPGCLIALCAANFIVGAAVAHFLYSWNQKCALQPLQALVMSFSPGWLWC